MTISSTANRTSTAGDGSVTAFSFPYLFFADNDLKVILVVDSTGVETTKTITTHYTVAGAGVAAGGTVTMGSAPAVGETLVIIREEQYTQGLDLVENDPFPSALVEQQLDTLTMLSQQLKDESDRSVKLSDGDTSGANLTLATPVANAYILWDAAGTALTSSSSSAGQFLGGNGTVSLPFYSYSSDPDSGMYRIGANNLGLALSGAKVVDYGTAGVGVTGTLTASSVITGTTIEATGDTSAGDNSALGYTSALGAILTGQGSTNDITLVNDADATVLAVPTGTTNVDIVGVATAATFEPDGDTSSSDNAAIGYTSAEGLILTGQGSTNDVTLKNDADGEVFGVPTGTTGVTFKGVIRTDDATDSTSGTSGSIQTDGGIGAVKEIVTDATVQPLGDTSASDKAAIGYTSVEGLIMTGQGSSYDFVLKNDADGDVARVATGTTVLDVPGSIKLASGATVTGIEDSDSLGSNSATLLATQQSIKAYVDSATAASAVWTDVVYLANSDSPYTIGTSLNGRLFAIDTSGGAVTINLPQISAVAASFTNAIKKTTSDVNAVTVVRYSGDEIDEAASNFTITIKDSGRTCVADTGQSPDSWTTMQFGATGGNMTVQNFAAGVGYTAGSSTAVTLSAAPASEDDLLVTMDGVTQHHNTYSLSGTTLTFDTAIPTGCANIEARWGSTLSINTTGDNTVGLTQLAGGTDGNLITFDASGDPAFVVTGSANQILTSNGAGAAPTMQTNPVLGQHTIWVPASAMEVAASTAPAASNAAEIGTSLFAARTIDFETSADDFAYFGIQMPKSWDAGALLCQFIWSATGTTANTVLWGLAANSLGDDAVLTEAFPTPTTQIDTNSTTADDVMISPEVSVTVGSTPTAEDYVVFEVSRDVSGDNLAEDARLHGIKIHYTTDAGSDT